MFKKSYLKQIFFGLIALLMLASCDKDFNELGTNIVGDDHFGFLKYSDASIQAYNQKLGPISSNNLPINPLGIYDNPVYGKTQANFVTQVELATLAPEFNNVDPEDYDVDPTEIDSVILDIPYFKTLEDELDADDNKVYTLDSIYGPENSKFQLNIYRSNYYLRDLDPNQSLGERQLFYTDMDAQINANRIEGRLNNSTNVDENDQFFFDKREKILTVDEDEDGTIDDNEVTRKAPSMRLHLNNAVFADLILNPSNSAQLVNNNVFKNFFRGLYFKTDGTTGQMAMLDFRSGKITIYYNEDKKGEDDAQGNPTFTRVDKTFVLNLTGNSVSLINNITENGTYLAAANSTAEASRLYLRGGEGAMSIIDLFGQADAYKYIRKAEPEGSTNYINDAEGDPLYVKVFTPNGVSDELDDLRYPLVDNSLTDHSTKERWMINDAQLSFTIDRDAMAGAHEPNRIFLYDLNNKSILVDYSFDYTTNSAIPKYSKIIHGGIIERDAATPARGVKYRIRITNHIRNLIMKDSTNVRLGLSVTENINNVAFSKLKTANSNSNGAPSMSVLNPLGTILYGTNLPVGDLHYADRIKFDIYYTKPD
ncbi:DUF4270 domain-containing protein [Flavobacterium terrisoli]|uniref:DUF4270 domain-containing protein n=1 Tax=Flavobacterium terrisoli TaxID=3242195 RepID=UPI002543B252|nr:DUF4270 domain-containing protein [Flavobacterium buctense]